MLFRSERDFIGVGKGYGDKVPFFVLVWRTLLTLFAAGAPAIKLAVLVSVTSTSNAAKAVAMERPFVPSATSLNR